MSGRGDIHGLAACFADGEALLSAVRKVRAAGYGHIEAYAPEPEPEIERALGEASNPIARNAVVTGVLSALAAYALQYYAAVLDYPFNAGGRPFHAWPPFLVVSFAIGLLGAVLAAGISMFVLNGFPAYYHPVFHLDGFGGGGPSRHVLVVAAEDPNFDRETTRQDLAALDPVALQELPR